MTLVSICWLATAAAAEYQERYRPQLHFSPPAHWMNDPNGMVYANGEYHLFYQYHPGSLVWGPMHWGHAASADLIHWKNRPIALYPDEHGVIFSGSAVLDSRNTSGLGTQQLPPLVALYTHHDPTAERAGRLDFQSQYLAYSEDSARTWVRYGDNPVLPNPGTRDFRDPKVFWFQPTGRWIMTLAVGDHVSFFSSPDLKHWQHESDFGRGTGAHGGVWECPDLIAMPVTRESSSRFVLLVSVNPGGPNGGSGTQYFVGEFDGHEFRPEPREASNAASDTQPRWIDYGPDDYAGVTWSGIPTKDGRILFLGWMSNWLYAQKVPTTPWRGAMTLPRELSLVRAAHGLELHSRPVAELANLRARVHRMGARTIGSDYELTHGWALSGLIEFTIRLEIPSAAAMDLELTNRLGQRVRLRIDGRRRRYELDRSHSGDVSFDSNFDALATAPIDTHSGTFELHGFLDRSSLDLFLNDGETVMTSLQFPSEPLNRLVLHGGPAVRLISAEVYELTSIWDSR